jgi:methylphosphotriester-DNA--protein-cysteine methyltransferase
MWTQGAENLGQMVEILKEKQEQHPWLSQLIAKLDESSDDETFKSQFYSNFKKYFQPYIIQYVKETKDPTGRVISTQLMNKVINQNALEKQLLEQYRAAW